MRYRFCLIFFFIFIFLNGFSQQKEYHFKTLTNADGLSQSSITTIIQDNLGQMWIGTRDGLNKYDGNNFTIYRNEVNNPASISNNDILALEEDSNGNIWVGTFNGVNKYDPKSNVFKRYFHKQNDASLNSSNVFVIKELSNGDIWIGTSNGISVYDKSTDSFKDIPENTNANSLLVNSVSSIFEMHDGSVFVGTSLGVSQLIDKKKFKFKTLEGTKGLNIQDLIESPSNQLLMATRAKSVLQYNPLTEKVSSYFSDETIKNEDLNVRQLLFDNKENLWIGTYRGLQIANNKKEITVLTNDINNPKSLSNNSIKSLFKDNKGSIWIGTYYGGVNIWDESNVNFVSITQSANENGLGYKVISSIENYKDNIYFGTEGKGITVFNKKKKTFSYLNRELYPELPNNNIKALLVAKDHKLWIGAFIGGVAVFNLETNRFENNLLNSEIKDYLTGTRIYTIKEDGSKNIWFGTFGKGIVKYNPNTKILDFKEEVNRNLLSEYVRTIFIDSKKNIWFGTVRGLNKLDVNDKLTAYFYNKDIKEGDDILCVFEDSNKDIWIGTKSKGLFKFIGNDFEPVNLMANNSKVSGVHSVLEDEHKNLWMGTNQGMIKFNIKTQEIKLYDQKEGLVSNEFNDNASLNISGSHLYFGGPAGVTYFNPKEISINTYTPQVLLTDFKIQNKTITVNNDDGILQKSISYTKEITLNYDKANFSIDFSLPNFINADKNHYAYRLIGIDKQWIITKNTQAAYTIQKAGTYIFEIKGANNDGVWNETPTTLKIIVKPAPWKTVWAYSLYALLIGFAIYGLLWIMKANTKLKHKLQLEYVEAEKRKEINAAKLEFFTNVSHEFRTPLTLILGPLQQILSGYSGSTILYNKLLVIESSANHLLQLINRLMDFRKLEGKKVDLEAAEGNIVKFLKEIFLSFSEYAKDGNYTYSFNTSDDEILVYYDRYKLERVFYNLISNAFRYTPKGGVITIDIRKEDNQISVSVEDSGVGISEKFIDRIFDRFFEASVHNSVEKDFNKGSGIGLSIAKSIVELHNGSISVKNKTESGVIFEVLLPLGNSHLSQNEISKDFVFSDDLSQYVSQLNEPSKEFLKEGIQDRIKENKKHTILVVEDNEELRAFMSNLLQEDYNILQAENGKIAYDIALKQSPDLIVSDVMMPEMVGTELCALIKGNIETSHIPVILLTSRTSLVYKFEGLESGADDYISKPFNLKEFKLRIHNLIESKERLKEKFSSQNVLVSEDIEMTNIDEELLKKAIEIVENNISNEQFDIPLFCSELGISRSVLFVKIKAWTNLTPNKFIQEIRLNSAAKLLKQNKFPISQVCYKVGFNDPKYFGICFKNKFNMSPTQYANKFTDT